MSNDIISIPEPWQADSYALVGGSISTYTLKLPTSTFIIMLNRFSTALLSFFFFSSGISAIERHDGDRAQRFQCVTRVALADQTVHWHIGSVDAAISSVAQYEQLGAHARVKAHDIKKGGRPPERPCGPQQRSYHGDSLAQICHHEYTATTPALLLCFEESLVRDEVKVTTNG